MAFTKRQYIEQAFAEIGLAGYVFDLSPEQLQTALRQLDSMMAMWAGKGIKLGWPLALNPDNSDLDTETSITPWADEAIYLNLAIRIAPGFGKTLSLESKANAKMAYDAMLIHGSTPPQMQYPGTMPAGAGHKTWRDHGDAFMPQPNEDPLQVGPNGQLKLVGD